MALSTSGQQARPTLYCADCGLAITDNVDVDYTLDADGNVLTVLHTDAFHRELVGDEDDGLSPYAYYEQYTARGLYIVWLPEQQS